MTEGQEAKARQGRDHRGDFSQVGCGAPERARGGGGRTVKWDPALEPFPGHGEAWEGAWDAAGISAGPTGLLHPFCSWEPAATLVFSSACCSLSWGSWQIRAGLLAGGAWAPEPGISSQTLTVSFCCGSRPVPTPHLCQARAPAFCSPGEGRGPGRGDRWGPSPHEAALRGPSMTHCPLRERRRWVGGAWSAIPARCKLRLEFSPS